MTHIIELSFCTIKINENIVIGTINQGVHLNLELSKEIVVTVYKYIGNNPVVYITNRINSYSVDPTLYKYISKISTIQAFCVVHQKTSMNDSSVIENLFYKNRHKQVVNYVNLVLFDCIDLYSTHLNNWLHLLRNLFHLNVW